MTLQLCNRGTGRALAVTLVGVGALWLFLLRDPNFFWRNDYQLWYSPIFEESVRALREGEWPILTRCSWATANLGGEYQAGTFSLWHQALLQVLWSFPLSLPGKAAALALVHLALAAAGMVLLARQRGATAPIASTLALSATWSGWLVSWGASQWFVALAGFSWLPWAWWSLERALGSGSPRGRWLAPGLLVYLLISEGSPFSVAMLALVSLWLFGRTVTQTRRWSAAWPLLVAWGVGLALSAPAWWMLLELHRYSLRAEWGGTWQWAWLVPGRAWLGIILPSVEFPWRDFWSQFEPRPAAVLLGGFVPLVALVADGWWRWRRRRHRQKQAIARSLPVSRSSVFVPRFSLPWDLALAGALALLCSLPLLGSFRWSFRWLPLFHLCWALAAVGALRRVSLKILAPCGLLLALLAGSWAYASGALGSRRFVLAEILLLAALWAGAWLPRAWRRWVPVPFTLALAAAGFTLLDLQRSSFAYSYPMGENLLQADPLERSRLYLAVSSGRDQLAGLSATAGWGAVLRPANTPMLAGLHFLNGYSSFTPFGVPEWFETFGNVKPEKAKALLSPQADSLLELLGVDGLVIGPEYQELAEGLGPAWEKAHVAPEAIVYHHQPPRARSVHVLPLEATQTREALPTAELIFENRTRVQVQIKAAPAASGFGGAVVTFARPFLPGYQAQLGSEYLPVQCYAGVIPMVIVPAGSSGQLILRFAPPSLRFGLPLALSTAALLLLGGFLLGRKTTRT